MQFPKLFKNDAPENPPAPEAKPKILVVDDEEYLNDVYTELLKSEGYEVTSAFDGQEALTLIAANQPDLILLDIMMPVMNGNEVLAKLKENEKTKNIPIIMLTNAGNIDNMATARSYNVREFFIKSNIIPSDITKAIRGILGKGEEEGKGYSVVT